MSGYRVVRIAAIVLGGAGVASLCAAEAAGAKRPRAVSERLARNLAEVMPKHAPADGAAVVATSAASGNRLPLGAETPANGIVRLPEYLVRERKPAALPSAEDVMSRRSLENLAMEKYLGEETDLRRVLSMFTPLDIWRRIPVLGKHPFAIGGFSGPGSGPAQPLQTNAERAMAMYERDRRRERWANLEGLMSPDLAPAPPAESPPPRK